MRPPATALILAACYATALVGCGLRGPLYLPEEQARTDAEAARTAPAENDGKITIPQPAPQAQKRDRPSTAADPAAVPPAN